MLPLLEESIKENIMEKAPEPVKEKMFRLKPEEDAKLPSIIEYANKAGYIAKPSFQEFMLFALNCAYTRLKDEYEARKGRR